jgi:RNA recognition motif-containing protein
MAARSGMVSGTTAMDQSRAKPMKAKLFVGNLAFGVKEKDLVELFSPFGVVVDTKIMMDRETNRPRGITFRR